MNLEDNKILLISALFFAGIMFLPLSILFMINSTRFGMDQLHNSPTVDSILFIHWYVWIHYFSLLITSLPWNLLYDISVQMYNPGVNFLLLLSILILSLLTLSLSVTKFKNQWFFTQLPGINPYKLVYRVTKFAYQHKVPLRRSAFTYCDDEFPSRIDFGKRKYGGPFTTKEVEDVKAFWGILKVASFFCRANVHASICSTISVAFFLYALRPNL